MPSGLPRVLIFCIFIRDVICDCSVGGANECQAASFVPGSNLAGEGYDVVSLRAKGAFIIDVNAWLKSDGTCTLCRNQLLSNARQRLPLSLVDWRVMQSCKLSLSSRLFRSAAELDGSVTSVISNDWKVDLPLPPKPAITTNFIMAGSKSKLMGFGTSRAKSDRYSFTSHEFRCRYYQYRVKDQPLLSAQFSHALANLPKALTNDTKYQYQKLVSTYGTHFIRAVELGGHFKDVTAIRTCEAASKGLTAEEVKDCLEVEASARVGLTINGSARYQRCKGLARSLKQHDTFHQAFSDRETEVTGGSARQGVDLFFSEDKTAFTRWADSLPVDPGIVRNELEPLHHLLPPSDPRHANLARYISDYILANALSQNCGGSTCPSGSFADRRDPCSCLCRDDSRVSRQCCSKEKGLGQLSVRVKEGHDLWGDYTSATDGYVIVKYGQIQARTPIKKNTNNPIWNEILILGLAKAESAHQLTVEVWDQDKVLRGDLLGTCQRPLTSGTHSDICYLKYGSVTFDTSFTCGPHLGGPTCQSYVPSPDGPTFTTYLRATSTTRLPISPVPSPSENPVLAIVFP
ncbi:perforin-1-like [Scyliorhinus canicula]|uniref:perforin-1-like n=1 Tax=Scyliorhinus canicula TaxID=7830 RepID=UPI0018F65B7E|nr:perforin-1-like [Scyliorhinus canicula]